MSQSIQSGKKTPVRCQKCGLNERTSGSMTSWIFNTKFCSCKKTDSAPNNLKSASVAEPSTPGFNSKTILNERYEIQEFVGQGGSSNVYKAIDLETNQVIAIKMMRPEFQKEEQAIKRLLQEAEMSTRLIHQNLISVQGYGQDKNGLPYITMDFITGQSLDEFLAMRQNQLSEPEILGIVTQIGQGLQCSHAHGLIHRDLKPSNIVIDVVSVGVYAVKIIDFGFSRLVRASNDNARLTQTDEAFGSPAYMSPEHCLGKDLDARSDIYSLGCVMYEIITGRAPLIGKNILATIANQVSNQPLPPTSFNSEISESLQNVVMRCLAKEPVHRYQTVSDLLGDLQRVQTGQSVETIETNVKSKRSDVTRTTDAPARTRRLLIAGGWLVGAIFVFEILAAVIFIQNKDAFNSPQQKSTSKAAEKIAHPPPTQAYQTDQKPPVSHPLKASVAAPVSAPISSRIRITKTQIKNVKEKVIKPKQEKPDSSGWDELKNLRKYK